MASIFRSLLWVGLLLSSAAWSLEVDLYRYQTLVTNQSTEQRNQAVVDGLAEVVVRASGQRSVLSDPGVQRKLESANSYLLEYRYEATDQTLQVDGKTVPARRLVLQFSEDSVERLLRELRLSIWPANRPEVLVWVVVDDRDGRRVAAADSEVWEGIRRAAEQRGVPLLTPLLDLQDQVAMTSQTLWSLEEGAIRDGSERYQPGAILVGRLTETSQGQWRGNWMLLAQEDSQVFDSRGRHVGELAAEGINQTADYFFARYGYQPREGDHQALIMQVGGVQDYADYTNLLAYVADLAPVQRVDLSVALGDYVLLTITTEAEVALLQQALKLDQKLLPETGAGNTGVGLGGPENPLKYQWRQQ